MIRVTILYPNVEGSRFDMNYYLNQHAALIKERLTPLGLIRVDLEEGLSGMAPGTPAPYRVIGSLTFNTLEDIQRALATHGEELIADIPNYTDIQAQMLITRVIEPVQVPTPMAAAVL
jgi:uncharacterized protein (TIGR02118 family)